MADMDAQKGGTGQTGPVQPPQAEVEPEATAGQALSGALHLGFRLLKYFMVFLVAFYLLRGFFTVDQQEVKLKTSFGAVVQAKGQTVLRPGTGLYYQWPWEGVVEVPTAEQVLEFQTEFWPLILEGERRLSSLDVRRDGYLITGDTNIVHMKLRVRYRVVDDTDGVLAYAFHVKDPEQILKRAARAAVTKVVGSMRVEDVLQRRGLFEAIRNELVARLEAFERQNGCPLGLEVANVEAIETQKVKNPAEPGPTSQAFYRAQAAESLRDKLISEGEAEAKKIINLAEAEATRIRENAAAEKVRLVQAAEADARRMRDVLAVYERSAEVRTVFRRWYYQWAVEEMLRNVRNAFVLHETPDGSRRELRLQLATTPPETKINVPQPAAGAEKK